MSSSIDFEYQRLLKTATQFTFLRSLGVAKQTGFFGSISLIKFTQTAAVSLLLLMYLLLPGIAKAETTFCPIYPLGISSDVVAGAAIGETYDQIPTRVDAGNFSWLTWAGSPSAPVLANSLIPPGDSDTYINPFDEADVMVNIGDWVMGSPGVTGSRLVKQNLSALLGQNIVVPVWQATQDKCVSKNNIYVLWVISAFLRQDFIIPFAMKAFSLNIQ